MTDANDTITPITDGLSMGMDTELIQLDVIGDLTQQINQSNAQMSKMLDSLENTNKSTT